MTRFLRYIIIIIFILTSTSHNIKCIDLSSDRAVLCIKSSDSKSINFNNNYLNIFSESSYLTPCQSNLELKTDKDINKHNVDSIIELITKYSTSYVRFIDSFEGEVYVKGNTELIQSNFLFWIAPDLFPFSRKNECSVFEILNKVSYEAPDNFSITPIAINSSVNNAFTLQEDITPLLDINIYKKSSFGNRYIIPGSPDAIKKYIYKYKGDTIINNIECLKIEYTPIFNHLKLVSGFLYINSTQPLIVGIEANGRLNFSNFKTYIEFGSNIRTIMLPQKSIIKINYNIANNISEFTYTSTFLYNKINVAYNINLPFNKTSLDRTIKYNKDSIRHISDDKFWEYYRDKPLNYDEVCMIEEKKKNDQISINNDSSTVFSNKKIQDFIIANTTFKKESFQWKYHGLLNPALIGYSPVNGIVLRQRISYTRYFENGSIIYVKPEIGYATKSKELFYGINNNYLFTPRHLGQFSLRFRSGNQGFNSKFINEVNQRLDSTKFDFKDLDIEYYRDYHFQTNISREIINGLLVDIGAEYNIHSPEKKINVNRDDQQPLINNNYADFIPFIKLTYIPFQPYRYLGKRKEYLDTKSPIFSVEYAKGIKGVMNSNSSFDRFEIDMHQKISLFNLSFFSYRVGMGKFLNQKDEYFVRFNNFQRSNYPSTWNDNIGGVFNVLDSKWYYSSPEYFQIHALYDTPFFLL